MAINNGIYLCWGKVAGSSIGGVGTVTLPITFTSFYSLVTGGNYIDLSRNNLLAQYGCWYFFAVDTKTLGNFRYSSAGKACFIAIGI